MACQPVVEKFLQPGAFGHVMQGSIGEMAMARQCAWQFETIVTARGPAMHHRVGHIGMKLEAERTIETKRLHREVTALRQQFGAVR